MARKSRRSASRKAKSFPKQKAAAWSTDDVYNLLKAVNEITLKRMENKSDAMSTHNQDNFEYLINRVLANISSQIRGAQDAAGGARVDIRTLRDEVIGTLFRMQQDLAIIKSRVGGLSGRHSTEFAPPNLLSPNEGGGHAKEIRPQVEITA